MVCGTGLVNRRRTWLLTVQKHGMPCPRGDNNGGVDSKIQRGCWTLAWGVLVGWTAGVAQIGPEVD